MSHSSKNSLGCFATLGFAVVIAAIAAICADLYSGHKFNAVNVGMSEGSVRDILGDGSDIFGSTTGALIKEHFRDAGKEEPRLEDRVEYRMQAYSPLDDEHGYIVLFDPQGRCVAKWKRDSIRWLP